MAQVNSGDRSAAARAVRYGFPASAASIGYIFTEDEMKNKWRINIGLMRWIIG